jgi:predicted phage baseplate assembly protein
VTLPQLKLDDRDFQSLVNEARLRIAKTCPEWTEHNVSDPGITLIEVFAWMTDILLYRVNRIPENVEIALLNLLAIKPDPPAAARAAIRFRLTAPIATTVAIPASATEVSTRADDRADAVVFRVARDTTVPAVALEALALARDGDIALVPARRGVASPTGALRPVFASPPVAGDAFYLGTPTPLGGLVVQVTVRVEVARGAGIAPDAPPWIWEVSPQTGDAWSPVEVLEDSSGGLNENGGVIELQLPPTCGTTLVAGLTMYWLRCRLPDPPGYLGSPEVDEFSIAAVGVLVDAQHASTVELETLGTSDGTPNQSFRVLHAPTLALDDGEGLEVYAPDPRNSPTSRWRMWERVDSFAESDASSAHYIYDPATGEVRLGPSIRVPRQIPAVTGSAAGDDEVPALQAWKQCGMVPPPGAILRMTRYHHGGGWEGNVPARAIEVLRTPIPGVASVTNPRPATGGIGLEDIRHIRERAARELRTRYRAVTPGDYEILAPRASSSIARVRCERPAPGEAIPVRVLPRPPGDLARFLSREELTPSTQLLEQCAAYLQERSPIGASIHVTPVGLRCVTVVVEVEAEVGPPLGDVEKGVLDALYAYLNPIVGGDPSDDDDDGDDGWEWGRRLIVGELHPIVRALPDVRFVIGLRAYETELLQGTPQTHPDSKPLDRRLDIGPAEVIASGIHQVRAVRARRR